MLQIYNSLTRRKEPFQTMQPNLVKMYVCGITVYDYCHIGHARVYVTFDVMARFLRAQGYKVVYVRNITDIDDKIINRAKENNEAMDALTARYIKAMHEDFNALNILPPDAEPRATEHIDQIIQMIQSLLEKGYAYVGNNGDIYYKVSQFKDYGTLSRKDLAGLRAGARVEIAEAKQDPLDFVLWKLAKPNEPQWDTPWGAGRPGWHIECSAMSTECLGNHFDIHGGGFDLQFPHHENELAQAEAATSEKFVNTWMHVGFVQIDKEKMSKSLNNFFTIREVLAQYPAEVIRYFLISSHYRSPINYSQESLNLAHASLQRLYTALRGLPIVPHAEENEYTHRFHEALKDDFNTPQALSVLFELIHTMNRKREQNLTEESAKLGTTLRQLGALLGILQQDPEVFLRGKANQLEESAVEKLIEERNAARSKKDWMEADRIRQQLEAMGIQLEDTVQGTTWRYVS
jgi:cysteinyl-tRNA synthetase